MLSNCQLNFLLCLKNEYERALLLTCFEIIEKINVKGLPYIYHIFNIVDIFENEQLKTVILLYYCMKYSNVTYNLLEQLNFNSDIILLLKQLKKENTKMKKV